MRELPLIPDRYADYAGTYRRPIPWLEGAELEVRVWDEADRLHMSQGRAGVLLNERVHLVPLGNDVFAGAATRRTGSWAWIRAYGFVSSGKKAA